MSKKNKARVAFVYLVVGMISGYVLGYALKDLVPLFHKGYQISIGDPFNIDLGFILTSFRIVFRITFFTVIGMVCSLVILWRK